MIYKTLNDARRVTGDEGFAKGRTKIWYWKPEVASDYQMGYEWLRDEGIPVPDAKTLSATHVRLGAIKEKDPGRVLELMQSWSPSGEADSLVQGLGLSHTRMTVGDIIHLANGHLLMVDHDGFAELASRRPNPGASVETSPVRIPLPLGQPTNKRSSESLRRSLLR